MIQFQFNWINIDHTVISVVLKHHFSFLAGNQILNFSPSKVQFMLHINLP
jgi:hypothetical protein